MMSLVSVQSLRWGGYGLSWILFTCVLWAIPPLIDRIFFNPLLFCFVFILLSVLFDFWIDHKASTLKPFFTCSFSHVFSKKASSYLFEAMEKIDVMLKKGDVVSFPQGKCHYTWVDFSSIQESEREASFFDYLSFLVSFPHESLRESFILVVPPFHDIENKMNYMEGGQLWDLLKKSQRIFLYGSFFSESLKQKIGPYGVECVQKGVPLREGPMLYLVSDKASLESIGTSCVGFLMMKRSQMDVDFSHSCLDYVWEDM